MDTARSYTPHTGHAPARTAGMVSAVAVPASNSRYHLLADLPGIIIISILIILGIDLIIGIV